MFTVFHLFTLAGALTGLALGSAAGARLFGVAGGVAGALIGGWVGLIAGRLPEFLVLRSLARELGSKSAEELRVQLRSPDGPTPNLVLLELKSRGEDVASELPVVLGLLVSEDEGRRSHGWAALSSAFPRLAEELRDYRVGDSVEQCRRKTERLRAVAGAGSEPGTGLW